MALVIINSCRISSGSEAFCNMDKSVSGPIKDTMLFSCFYFIMAGVSLYLSQWPDVATNLWLPNAIGIVLLLRINPSQWFIPITGICIAIFSSFICFGNNGTFSACFTIVNAFEIIIIVAILARYKIVDNFDSNIKNAIIFIATLAFIAPAFKAALLAIFWADKTPMYWYLSDSICLVSTLPIALLCVRRFWRDLTMTKIGELLLYIIIIFSAVYMAVAYLAYPFVILISLLLFAATYVSVSSTLLLTSACVFYIFTLFNAGLFLPVTGIVAKLSIQVYYQSIVVFILPYLLAVYIAIFKKTTAQLEMSEFKFRSVMEGAGVGMALVSLDGYWFMVNDALCKLLEYSKEEFKKLRIQDLTYSEDLTISLENLAKLYEGIISGYSLEKRYVCKSGKTIWARLSVTLIRDNNMVPQYYVGHIEDITENKLLESANNALTCELYAEKEQLKTLLTSIVDSVIATDENGIITFMNPEAEKITGWAFQEAKGLHHETIFKVVSKTTNRVLKSPITKSLEKKKSSPLLQDALLINIRGEKYDIQYAISLLQNKDNKTIGVEIIFQNVSQAKSMQEELNFNATHDSLTGLLNRREFENAMNKALKEIKSKKTQYILCYLDLDNFKIINDTAGHTAGDALLQEIAGLLHHRLRKVDVIARLGGDEFAILLSNCSLSAGKQIAEELVTSLGSIRFPWKNKIYRISVSIGMVLMSNPTTSSGQLLTEADVACYSAKARGRNCYFVYHSDEIESTEHHRQMIVASTIQEAIEDNRLLLYVQRVIPTNPKKGNDFQFEILIRMRDEQQRILMASEFVHTAERFDLMEELDRWVLEQIFVKHHKNLSRWENASFSINLSANSLNNPKFMSFLSPLIQKSAIAPERICFEITETAAMTHISKTILIVEALQKIGCKIALDDFGVGLSSFSYVKNFSVDYVKIDGSFVKNLVNSKVDYTIVSTINDMAHRLGMETIAEYVESEEILKKVTKMGVDYAQGYLIGKPLPLDKLLKRKF